MVTLGELGEPAFSKPPAILNILVKNGENSSVLTSNLISDKISKILSGENQSGKVAFSKKELSSALIGSQLYTGKNIKRMAIIAEGSLSNRGFSDYKISVGSDNFGFGIFDSIASIAFDKYFFTESFTIKEGGYSRRILLFVLDNVEISEDGKQPIVITKKIKNLKQNMTLG